MEILYIETKPMPNPILLVVSLLLAIAAVVVTIIGMYFGISDKEPDLIERACCAGILAIFFGWLLYHQFTNTQTFTYAKVAPDTPYVEIAREWNYVSNQGDVYCFTPILDK